jgi:hypothetical protein
VDNLELESWVAAVQRRCPAECPAFFDFTRRLSARLDSFRRVMGHIDLEI